MLDISTKQLNYIIEHVHTECQLAFTFADLFSVSATPEVTTYNFKCQHTKHNDSQFVLFVKIFTHLPEALCEAYVD